MKLYWTKYHIYMLQNVLHTYFILLLVKTSTRYEITSHIITSMTDVITRLNFWKWIKPSFTTPAALQLYDFLISCMLRQLSRIHTYVRAYYLCVCRRARANEYVKDCYYSSQYKLYAQDSLADVSIIHVRVLKHGGVGIASQLREEEEDEQEAGRAEASTASFITNLFHPVVEMGYCSLRASKATSMSSTSRYEREILLSSGRAICTSSSVSIRVRSLTFLSKCQI